MSDVVGFRRSTGKKTELNATDSAAEHQRSRIASKSRTASRQAGAELSRRDRTRLAPHPPSLNRYCSQRPYLDPYLLSTSIRASIPRDLAPGHSFALSLPSRRAPPDPTSHPRRPRTPVARTRSSQILSRARLDRIRSQPSMYGRSGQQQYRGGLSSWDTMQPQSGYTSSPSQPPQPPQQQQQQPQQQQPGYFGSSMISSGSRDDVGGYGGYASGGSSSHFPSGYPGQQPGNAASSSSANSRPNTFASFSEAFTGGYNGNSLMPQQQQQQQQQGQQQQGQQQPGQPSNASYRSEHYYAPSEYGAARDRAAQPMYAQQPGDGFGQPSNGSARESRFDGAYSSANAQQDWSNYSASSNVAMQQREGVQPSQASRSQSAAAPTAQNAPPSASPSVAAAASQPAAAEAAVPKKRGRKPKNQTQPVAAPAPTKPQGYTQQAGFVDPSAMMIKTAANGTAKGKKAQAAAAAAAAAAQAAAAAAAPPPAPAAAVGIRPKGKRGRKSKAELAAEAAAAASAPPASAAAVVDTSMEAPPAKRKRRTKLEMQAARAAEAEAAARQAALQAAGQVPVPTKDPRGRKPGSKGSYTQAWNKEMVAKVQGLRVFGSMIEDDKTQKDFDRVVIEVLGMLDGKLPGDKK
ncbi:uncharacterized protein PAN0_008d3619 [Moesziomyces antarcticus]|uniref:Uncharacterized protein n=2 Tax=Pseudozyma antarctica TaxID=84753 RepID=A0A081CFF6_PSEA2|nr:uncharacterized protein PAN0_008d3619 [Moesziomyces antarcticus]GAK65402.1 conserved hypothetical protein [Moesziomyces antarcticus]